MLESKSIERFLSNNSSINPQPAMGTVKIADMKTMYRPDKLCPRDSYMKWDLIYSGIDTPHRLARGGDIGIVDRTWLATELSGIKDFKI